MAENQKYFLDLVGLTKLWGKIKASFADKEQTQTSIDNINSNITDLDGRIQVIDNDVNNLETSVLTIAPREVNYYSEAIEASKELAVGTTINVKYPETSAEDSTPSGYSTGIYIVVGNGEIKYISTSDGDADASDITALGNRVESLESTVVKSAEVIDENGTQLGQSFSVTENVLLISHDDVFDINTDSVKSLTHRAVAAKFKDIENSLTQIPKFKISVVDELPTNNISLSTIYLLRNTDAYTNNLFTEYIYVETVKDDPTTTDVNESKFEWEKLGEQTLVVDDIVTKDDLNNALNIALLDYAKTTDVKAFIQEANENLKIEILGAVEKTYATKEELNALAEDIESITGGLDNYLTKEEAALTYLTQTEAADTYLTITDAEQKGWVTEADILTSIQSGNIGNAIVITEEQIENMIAES
jgi:hypothetical protein